MVGYIHACAGFKAGLVIGLALCSLVTGQTTDPSNLACRAINSTVIELTWTQATDASVLGYHVDVIRVDGLRIEPHIPTIDLPDKTFDEYEVAGLGHYGTYSLTIHSYVTGSNLTDYSINCTTDEDVPDLTSASLYCEGVTVSAIQCTWTAMDQVYWNGVALGWRLQHLQAANMSVIGEVTVDGATLTATATGLRYGTTYTLLLNAYTAVGHGTMYITTTASTMGIVTTTEEAVTRHYCNEFLPGMIVFAWEEMPCTIYSGTIAGLIAIVVIFISIFACQACCGKGGGNLQLNINNDLGGKRGSEDSDDDDDDSDDGYDKSRHSSVDDDDDVVEDGEDKDIVKTPMSDIDEADGRETRDSRYSGTPDSVKSPKPTSETGMGEREQSGVVLDGALSARQVFLEADDAQNTADSDYNSQTDYDDDDDDDDDIGDAVPSLPIFKSKTGQNAIQKGGRTETNSQQRRPSTKTSPRTVNNHTKSSTTSANPRPRSKSKVVVTTAAVHALNTQEDSNVNDVADPWQDIQNAKSVSGGNVKTLNRSFSVTGDVDEVDDSEDMWGAVDKTKSINSPQYTKQKTLKTKTENSIDNEWGDPVEKSYKPKDANAKQSKWGAADDINEVQDSFWDDTQGSASRKVKFTPSSTIPAQSMISRDHAADGVEGRNSIWANNKGDANNDDNLKVKNSIWDKGNANNVQKITRSSINPTRGVVSRVRKGNKLEEAEDSFWDDTSGTANSKQKLTSSSINSAQVVKSESHEGKQNGLKDRANITTSSKNPSSNSANKTPITVSAKGSLVGNHTDGFKTQTAADVPTSANKGINKTNVQSNKDNKTNPNQDSNQGVLNSQQVSSKTDVDTVLLTSEKQQSVSDGSRVVTKTGKTPGAWTSLPQDKSSSGKRTPVREVKLQREWTAIEIEPVLDTDRLGKKFPFLNVTATSGSESVSVDTQKSVVMSKHAVAFTKAFVNPQNTNDTSPKEKDGSKGSKNSGLFYGFGVGRFRKYASAWLAKFRAKKDPVKTLPSVWN